MTVSAKHASVHAVPQGPGDARPTALQIVRDEGLEGKLDDLVVLITGGSSGLGIETARAMAATGAQVMALVTLALHCLHAGTRTHGRLLLNRSHRNMINVYAVEFTAANSCATSLYDWLPAFQEHHQRQQIEHCKLAKLMVAELPARKLCVMYLGRPMDRDLCTCAHKCHRTHCLGNRFIQGKSVQVVVTARNADKGAAAVKEIQGDKGEAYKVSYIEMELSSLKSVRVGAQAFKQQNKQLNVLMIINNAGVPSPVIACAAGSGSFRSWGSLSTCSDFWFAKFHNSRSRTAGATHGYSRLLARAAERQC